MEKINIIDWFNNNKTWLLSGVGVSFLIVLWRLIKKLFEIVFKRRGKLIINCSFKQAWVKSLLWQSPFFPLYGFEIVNAGNSEIEIKDVRIYFCGKKINTRMGIADGLTQINNSFSGNYRGTLAPKKAMKGNFEINALLSVIANQIKPSSNIQLQVIDSLGNKYYSKKTKYQKFLNNVQLSNKVNIKKDYN